MQAEFSENKIHTEKMRILLKRDFATKWRKSRFIGPSNEKSVQNYTPSVKAHMVCVKIKSVSFF